MGQLHVLGFSEMVIVSHFYEVLERQKLNISEEKLSESNCLVRNSCGK